MERWYRDIRIDARQQDWPQLSSRLMHGLHAFMSHLAEEVDYNPIAIGFPGWNTQSVGNLIRLVSNEPVHLEQLEYEAVVSRLLENCALQMTRLEPVPEDRVFANFFYCRDRRQEKRFVGFKKRQNRRRQQRGAELLPVEDELVRPPSHFISLKSSKTGNRFSLFIRRSQATEQQGKERLVRANNYGLSNAELQAAIPHFV